jgi:hypothetical protein
MQPPARRWPVCGGASSWLAGRYSSSENSLYRRCSCPFPVRGRLGHRWPPAGRRRCRASGIGAPSRSLASCVIRPLLSTTRGSTAGGMSSRASNSSSQQRRLMSKSRVREAFDGSVTCTLSADSFQASQLSIVPNASSPRSARARAPGDVVEQPFQFGAREIGVKDQTGPLAEQFGVTGCGEFVAQTGRAAILPNDRAVHWLATGAIPEDAGFALVGQADSGNLTGRNTVVAEHGTRNGKLRLPRFRSRRVRPIQAAGNTAHIPVGQRRGYGHCVRRAWRVSWSCPGREQE